MISLQRVSISLLIAAAFLTFVFSVPVYAQESTEDLRSAVQASLLADPRVANIPPEQLRILVDSLTAQAEAQNMTSADILWQPQNAAAASAAADTTSVCAPGWQGYFCEIDRTFGFGGGDYTMPIMVLVTSGLLLLVIWEMILHHRKKMAKKAAGAL